MDITRTIQKEERSDFVENWFTCESKIGEFPVPGKPTKDFAGDYLYIIYRKRIAGRFEIDHIEKIEPGMEPLIGSNRTRARGKYTIVVKMPGEKAPVEIQRRGHVGIRYDDVLEWP